MGRLRLHRAHISAEYIELLPFCVGPGLGTCLWLLIPTVRAQDFGSLIRRLRHTAAKGQMQGKTTCGRKALHPAVGSAAG